MQKETDYCRMKPLQNNYLQQLVNIFFFQLLQSEIVQIIPNTLTVFFFLEKTCFCSSLVLINSGKQKFIHGGLYVM